MLIVCDLVYDLFYQPRQPKSKPSINIPLSWRSNSFLIATNSFHNNSSLSSSRHLLCSRIFPILRQTILSDIRTVFGVINLASLDCLPVIGGNRDASDKSAPTSTPHATAGAEEDRDRTVVSIGTPLLGDFVASIVQSLLQRRMNPSTIAPKIRQQ